MRLRIHRGTKEIGGTCVELECQGERIVVDLGQPLDASEGLCEVPKVPGLISQSEGNQILGILLSHPHQDHYGLIGRADPSIPVFIGEVAARILAAANPFMPGEFAPTELRTFRDQTPFRLGPFSITPYLMDHSAYDAYAFLIEGDGQRIWYSGDFRGHGRKSALFDKLVSDPPGDLDVMLMEGTNVRPDDAVRTYPSEADLEEPMVQAFRDTPGLAFVWASGQNIDRLVTIYKAARRAGRRFIIDFYTAQVLRAIGNPRLPQPDWAGMHVFLPASQRHAVLKYGLTGDLDTVKHRRVYLDRMQQSLADWVFLFRPSLLGELSSSQCLVGSRLVYSLWPGYLDRPDNRMLRDRLAVDGIEITLVHTSGHASVDDLKRLVAALRPRHLVPIHTFAGDRFQELFPNVLRVTDGHWLTVPATDHDCVARIEGD